MYIKKPPVHLLILTIQQCLYVSSFFQNTYNGMLHRNIRRYVTDIKRNQHLSFNIRSFIKRETLLISWHFMYAHLEIYIQELKLSLMKTATNYIIIANNIKNDKQIKALTFKNISVIIFPFPSRPCIDWFSM